jgi:hypothetical protein
MRATTTQAKPTSAAERESTVAEAPCSHWNEAPPLFLHGSVADEA